MRRIKRYATKRINEVKGSTGPLWQQSFYDRVIRDERQLGIAIDYIHRNPVAAGLVRQPHEYLYSSAHPEAESDIQAFLSE